MNPLEIKRAVDAYLKANWDRTDILEVNKDDDIPKRSFIRSTFLPGTASSLEIRGASDRTGVFIIQVFTNLDVGTDEGLGHGGKLEELFRNTPLNDIEFQSGDMIPRTERVGKNEAFQKFQHNTIIPFTVITG